MFYSSYNTAVQQVSIYSIYLLDTLHFVCLFIVSFKALLHIIYAPLLLPLSVTSLAYLFLLLLLFLGVYSSVRWPSSSCIRSVKNNKYNP